MAPVTPATIPRDAQARLMLGAAMRGHRVASPGCLYADVDGEFLYAKDRAFVARVTHLGGADVLAALRAGSSTTHFEVVSAIRLYSVDSGTIDLRHVRSIRCAGYDEWSLTPVEWRA